MIELVCGITGAITGLALIPIYRVAFRTASYARVLWALPVVLLIVGSSGLALWLAREQSEDRRLLSLLVWLVSAVVAFVGGWRMSGSRAQLSS